MTGRDEWIRDHGRSAMAAIWTLTFGGLALFVLWVVLVLTGVIAA